VLTWTPEWSWRRFHRNHPDHRAVGEAVLSAVFPDARNPFAHPELLSEEGLEAWVVDQVWLVGSPSPNRYVDVTDTFERKLAALRAHQSQTAHRDALERDLHERLARTVRLPGCRPAALQRRFRSSRSSSWRPAAGLEQRTSLLGELPRRQPGAACADQPDQVRHVIQRPGRIMNRAVHLRSC
jgi:hypothetical protein